MDSNDRLVSMGDRVVSARLEANVIETADLVFAIAVAESYDRSEEHFSVRLDGAALPVLELSAGVGGRLSMMRGVGPGQLKIEYDATVTGLAPDEIATDFDTYRFARPSRYCQSDELSPLARDEFAGLHGAELLAAVSSWVGSSVAYVPGSSRPIDGAVATMLAREGVCRDFAHLTVALLRATEIPARVASVYAPGLDPMDFHAVAEACLDGKWYVVDPTCLAPRDSLVRIATGADASDTAFMTTLKGVVDLVDLSVSAAVMQTLPNDDVTELVALR